jgi:hypothetical protein
MKKLLLLGIIMLLAACGQSVGRGETAVTSEPSAPEPETSSPTIEPTAEIVHYPVAGTIAEAAQVRDSDWAKGAAEPLVSIIEYGDFQ